MINTFISVRGRGEEIPLSWVETSPALNQWLKKIADVDEDTENGDCPELVDMI